MMAVTDAKGAFERLIAGRQHNLDLRSTLFTSIIDGQRTVERPRSSTSSESAVHALAPTRIAPGRLDRLPASCPSVYLLMLFSVRAGK